MVLQPSKSMQIILTPLIMFTFLAVTSTGSSNLPQFWNCTYSAGNYTESSPFNASLSNAFSSLSNMSSSKLFSNVTVGSSEANRVYALFSCEHDIPLQMCHNCVDQATEKIQSLCHQSPKEAIIIYQECMVRYANRMIFSTMELEPDENVCGLIRYYTHTIELGRAVKKGFEPLIDEATKSPDYFAVGMAYNVVMRANLYFLVQCTPDLTKEACNQCLLHALNTTVGNCGNDGRSSGHTIGPSCVMRYDDKHFFYSDAPVVTKTKEVGPWVKALQVILSVLLVLLFLFIVYLKCLRACC